MGAAKEAGARYVVGSALRLGPAARRRFLPYLAREFPELAERYRRHYGEREGVSRDIPATRSTGASTGSSASTAFARRIPGAGETGSRGRERTPRRRRSRRPCSSHRISEATVKTHLLRGETASPSARKRLG